MYEIRTEASFSAAHHLRNYHGPCEKVHGHNWLVQVTVRCKELNDAGIGVDFRVVKGALREVLAELDHEDLNCVMEKTGMNPSSENIARYVFDRLKERVDTPNSRISRVEVFETAGNSAAYFETDDA